MRPMSFEVGGKASWGMVDDNTVIDLGSRAPSLRAALPNLPGVTADTAGLPRLAFSAVTYLPPIPDSRKSSASA